MSEEQRKAVLCRRRNASQIGAVERRIIDADDGQFTGTGRNERALIHEQGDLMPIRQLGILRDRHAAVMVVIAQGDEDRGNLAQMCQKPEQMRQSLGHVQQISGDKNPIWSKVVDRAMTSS